MRRGRHGLPSEMPSCCLPQYTARHARGLIDEVLEPTELAGRVEFLYAACPQPSALGLQPADHGFGEPCPAPAPVYRR